MLTKTPDDRESIDVKPRLRRSVTEKMTVVPEGGDIYSVSSQSGREYRVDARGGRCTCPDVTHNLDDDELCKHALRCAVVRGERVIPAGIAREAVDPLLGCAVETTPRAVATDGGRALEPERASEREQGQPDAGDDRPDDCSCWGQDDLPCFECWRAGFETPNPAAQGTDDDE